MKISRRPNALDSAVDTTSTPFDEDALELVKVDALDESEFDDFDPVDEEIAAYLDDELSPTERAEFERRIDVDSELRRRVDEARNAWNALDLLVADAPNPELTATTLERLNAETKSELTALETAEKRRRRSRRALNLVVAGLFGVAGFATFGAVFPDVQTSRERDCRVVERLAQLELVGDFEFLTRLAQTGLFDAPRPTFGASKPRVSEAPPRSAPDEAPNPSEKTPRAEAAKSFDELSRDRGFYRLQQKFERLDAETQTRWRALYRQIAAAPNAETLWRVSDNFCAWAAAFPNDSDRDRFLALPVEERLAETQKRVAVVEQFFAERRRFAENRSETATVERRSNASSQNSPDSQNASNENAPESPTTRALRSALPEDLRGENMIPISEKYVAFAQSFNPDDDRCDRRRDGILEFLKKTPESKLLDELSEKARGYLENLPAAERSSALGLLVSLSLCEREERRSFKETRPFQDLNRERERERDFGGGRPNNFDGRRREYRADPLGELAETLRDAPPPVRDYLTTLPAAEMRGYLWATHWGFLPFSATKNDAPNSPENRPAPNGFNPNSPENCRV